MELEVKRFKLIVATNHQQLRLALNPAPEEGWDVAHAEHRQVRSSGFGTQQWTSLFRPVDPTLKSFDDQTWRPSH